MEEQRLTKLKELVKTNIASYPDFPKPGILFRDIFSVLKNPEAFHALQELLSSRLSNLNPKPDVITALESRGFLFGPALALQLKLPFVPIRKRGKLPGKLHSVTYSLEYGNDTIEIQESSIGKGQNVVIIDDLLATGGTLGAACSLIEKCGANVLECIVVIELLDLKGRDGIHQPIHSLIQF
ncbi:adenine phosphoribosyltransferase [Schistocerca nitens]|uniref:adenine phosphoribosyltransferase n=1 Tax=Schistocerca nitens TaxID=7011 RepID=UPI002117B65B|nr:adenine phosphoribosyltransferase [Schistocerca nitens]